MGHLPEMANPQHAKKPMSTPKPISKLVAERICASEPAELKATPARGKLSGKVQEPAQVPFAPRHTLAAAQAIDYMPRGNFSKEEADMAFMAYFGEEVETEHAISQYW